MFDPTEGFTVNLSSEEAASEAREIILLPAGLYPIAITDIELAESKSAKNLGKPYYRVECTIQDEPGLPEGATGRKLYANAMLFDGALYTIVQMMKALNLEVNQGQMTIPGPEFWVGQRMTAVVRLKNKMVKDGDKYVTEYTEVAGKRIAVKQNDISGFKSYDAYTAGTGKGASKKSISFLP